jgi:hypothetical protein
LAGDLEPLYLPLAGIRIAESMPYKVRHKQLRYSSPFGRRSWARALLIEQMKLTIAKLRNERFGQSSERGALLEQLELQLADLERIRAATNAALPRYWVSQCLDIPSNWSEQWRRLSAGRLLMPQSDCSDARESNAARRRE